MLCSPSTDYLLGLASGQARVNGGRAIEGVVAKLRATLDRRSGARSAHIVVRDQNTSSGAVHVDALVSPRKDEVVVDAEAPGNGDRVVHQDAHRGTRNLVVLDSTLNGVHISTTLDVDTSGDGAPDVAVPDGRALQRAALDTVGHVLVGRDDAVLDEVAITHVTRC